jgi:hypothetical protein
VSWLPISKLDQIGTQQLARCAVSHTMTMARRSWRCARSYLGAPKDRTLNLHQRLTDCHLFHSMSLQIASPLETELDRHIHNISHHITLYIPQTSLNQTDPNRQRIISFIHPPFNLHSRFDNGPGIASSGSRSSSPSRSTPHPRLRTWTNASRQPSHQGKSTPSGSSVWFKEHNWAVELTDWGCKQRKD